MSQTDHETDDLIDSPRQPRRRGIYLLPNLFTTAAMFSGFYAIMAASLGRFENAALAILIAGLLDGMDGRVARMTSTESDFGKEYDSLSDMVAFGVAPALVIYEWTLHSAADWGIWWARLAWLCAFFYTACAALRLARFNSAHGGDDKQHFFGLPSPSAAGFVMFAMWFAVDYGIPSEAVILPAMVLTALAGALMVSNIRYRSFKDFNLSGKVSFFALVAFVGLLILVFIDPPTTLCVTATAYAASGPVFWLWDWRQARKQSNV